MIKTLNIFSLTILIICNLIFIPNLDGQNLFTGHFKGSNFKGSVYLEWTISDPSEVQEMIVEKKINDQSFKVCKNIVPFDDLLYLFRDKHTEHGKNEYRVKFVLTDGTYQISEILEFEIDYQKVEFVVYPNPFLGEIHAKLPLNCDSENNYELRIFNSFGHQIMRESIPQKKVKFEIQALSYVKPDTYLLHLYNNNELVETKRVIKQ